MKLRHFLIPTLAALGAAYLLAPEKPSSVKTAPFKGRNFAHRGLHRFQAEHWGIEDWQREIDWLLKKRLNMFMLRIGQDDLFQKAFPEVVSYPPADKPLPFTGDGFNDRTLFWDLRFRGQLRKQILEYAIDRDMITPEDCGTMTHWYSRTPQDFLEKVKPKLLSQPDGTNYAEATGLVWDIRQKENLDLYFRLTDTHACQPSSHR